MRVRGGRTGCFTVVVVVAFTVVEVVDEVVVVVAFTVVVVVAFTVVVVVAFAVVVVVAFTVVEVVEEGVAMAVVVDKPAVQATTERAMSNRALLRMNCIRAPLRQSLSGNTATPQTSTLGSQRLEVNLRSSEREDSPRIVRRSHSNYFRFHPMG